MKMKKQMFFGLVTAALLMIVAPVPGLALGRHEQPVLVLKQTKDARRRTQSFTGFRERQGYRGRYQSLYSSKGRGPSHKHSYVFKYRNKPKAAKHIR